MIMKKLVLLIFGIVLSVALSAQIPPSPNGDGSAPTGGGHTPVGGGAPLGGGIGILLALGVGYGLKKVYSVESEQD